MINLAADAARWRAASAAFARAGLGVERLEAVHGEALGPAARAALYDPALNARTYHRPLCAGEIGCYASHLAAWRRLVASGRPAMAVVEDDVEIDADLPAVLAALEWTALPWDLVKLVGRPTERTRRRAPLSGGRELVEYVRVPSLTSAYVISRHGAQKLLARRGRFGRPVDVDLRHWWECDLRTLGVQPYPVHRAPASVHSTIGERPAPTGPAARWHKLALQAAYSWRNWRATLRAPAWPAPTAAPAAEPHAPPGVARASPAVPASLRRAA